MRITLIRSQGNYNLLNIFLHFNNYVIFKYITILIINNEILHTQFFYWF
jgi:hypothetical protein